MDLLTTLAIEFGIPKTRKNQKIWFFRTKAGIYYEDFKRNGYIALGWDKVPKSLIVEDDPNRESQKKQIQALYPTEARPGLILGQMNVFYNEMHEGDLVIIPSIGSKVITVGTIGSVIDDVEHTQEGPEYVLCTYKHKRNVTWINSIHCWQDIYLFKAIKAQQTISDMTSEATLVMRNIFPVYISENELHFTIQKQTKDDLSLAANVDLLSGILQIADATSELYGKGSIRKDIAMKTAAGSPGFIEMILPSIPVSIIIGVWLVRFALGSQKGEDGSKVTGIMAFISKIDELVTNHKNREKTDAETQKILAENKLIEAKADQMKAEADKSRAEAELYRAQAVKINEEARALALENQQIELLPSGKTTEQLRQEGEDLMIPDQDKIKTFAEYIAPSADCIRKAATENGLSFDGKRIS